MNELTAAITEEENPLFEQRLNNSLDGLEYYYYDHLKNRISKLNSFTIVDYVLAMKVEIEKEEEKGDAIALLSDQVTKLMTEVQELKRSKLVIA